jgi:hypothetical protein
MEAVRELDRGPSSGEPVLLILETRSEEEAITYLNIDLAAGEPSVTLEEPGDCTRLKVVVRGPRDEGRLGNAVASVGRAEGTSVVWLRPDALRRMAAGRVDEQWEATFEQMLAYARSRGWLDVATGEIRAHCDWQ